MPDEAPINQWWWGLYLAMAAAVIGALVAIGLTADTAVVGWRAAAVALAIFSVGSWMASYASYLEHVKAVRAAREAAQGAIGAASGDGALFESVMRDVQRKHKGATWDHQRGRVVDGRQKPLFD